MKKNVQLALLGPAGSFSDEAAKKLGRNFAPVYCKSFRDVFNNVKSGMLGFLPVRNKIVGEIPETASFFRVPSADCTILKSFKYPISFVLAVSRKMHISQIRTLYTSPVVADQCRKFIHRYLPHVRIFFHVDSSSDAIKKIVQLKPEEAEHSAAIGSEKAAKMYGLKVLERRIQDDPKDWTEFVLFG